MPENTAAVVPGISTQSSAVAVRSLGRADVTPIIASDGQPSPALSSKYCDEVVDVPKASESLTDYANALIKIAEHDQVRTILPLREADVYALAMERKAFSCHLNPVWPDFNTLRSAQDRRTLISIAEDLGIPVPQTRVLTDYPDDDGMVVVKPRYSIIVDEKKSKSWEPSVRVFNEHERPSISSIIDEMGHVPIVQEYVPTDGEFGYFALMNRGDPVATFQHHRIRSFTYSGGASVYRKSIDCPKLKEHGEKLLSELNWHGPAMVEFRRDARDGSFKLMEINPRFWGSLALPVHAGVDFPLHYFELSIGNPPNPESVTYQNGVGSHLLTGELVYLYNLLMGAGHGERPSIGREAVTVAKSLYQQPNFDLLSTDDPFPFVSEGASIASQVGTFAVDRILR